MSILENLDTRSHVDAARAREAAIDTLRRRAAFLLPPDRALLELSLGGTPRRQIGQLLGIPGGTVTRRLRRLTTRLRDPTVVALIHRPAALRPEYRQLGLEFFLQAQTVRELADLHQMSRREVQRILEYLRGWVRGMSEGR